MAYAGYVTSPPPAAAMGHVQPAVPMYAPVTSPPAAAMAPAPAARPGTLPVGTRIMIGQYKVIIERYLSQELTSVQGGFAHVYVVRSAAPITVGGRSQSQHVLKRLAVPDKQQLQEVRKEVENMKRVSGHPHIVNFIEASASQLPSKNGYEIFILMEFVAGGGIIDMMNTRLQNRLTETEILKIFSDTVEAVAHMHHLDPPMMHRDLKVENILMASPRDFKLCDFGSATVPLAKPPQTMPEIQALENDLNRTTTLQYRSPEMLDVWARKHVGLPADVWALGVFLYKLCYYTTPFEPHGVLAIQNVNYSFPKYPAYSAAMRDLIASMLQGECSQRPDIDAVYRRVCQLRGINPQSSGSEPAPALPRRPKGNLMNSPLHTSPSAPTTLNVLAPVKTPEPDRTPSLADAVAPMRRGRPASSKPAQPSPAPVAAAAKHQKPDFGFDDTFKPSSAESKPSPRLQVSSPAPRPHLTQRVSSTSKLEERSPEIADFVSSFPALDDDYSISGSTASPQVTGEGQSSAPQIQRQASGFQDLLAPTPSGATPATSRPPSQPAPQRSTQQQADRSASQSSLRLETSAPPIIPPKPKLVTAASQTSPELLDRWWRQRKQVVGDAESGDDEESSSIKPSQLKQRHQSSEPPKPLPKKLVSIGEPSTSSETAYRQNQPKFDLLADSPPLMDAPEPRHSASDAVRDVQNALPGLRSNYMANGSFSLDKAKDAGSKAERDDALAEAMQRFKPLEETPSQEPHSAPASSAQPRSSREPVSSGSEDEAEPEDLDKPQHALRSPALSPPAPASSQSLQSQQAYMKPSASSSYQSRTPSATLTARPSPAPATPEIIAPVAQKPKAVITGLVSRYETMSAQPGQPERQISGSSSSARRRPMSLYGTASSRSPVDQKSAQLSPVQDSAADRVVPFKPSKPAGPKPQVAPKPQAAMSPPPPLASQNEDEPFVGVARMKERWQTGSLQRGGSVRQGSAKERQEWKAV